MISVKYKRPNNNYYSLTDIWGVIGQLKLLVVVFIRVYGIQVLFKVLYTGSSLRILITSWQEYGTTVSFWTSQQSMNPKKIINCSSYYNIV